MFNKDKSFFENCWNALKKMDSTVTFPESNQKVTEVCNVIALQIAKQ